MSRAIHCVAATVVFVAALGCSKAPGPTSSADLEKSEMGDIYDCLVIYTKNQSKPPQQLSDLKKYEVTNGLAYRVLKEGKYVAVWGTPPGDGKVVLAYHKDATTQGGAVLMGDGSMKTMTAADLQAALKAKGK
ncbi:MAG: hypothetical protein U0746_20820 [Gemmataceae bacterium]